MIDEYLAFVRARETYKRVAIVMWGFVSLYVLWLTSARNGLVGLGASRAC